ncbi:hypothetical protein ROZALSC1DRAFT_24544 [Rozella allomycis CSF55]|uniref:Uncharacterized protein n=1 Tax=Rozella allomycis (strain CSF55) TaxID=988480 RepID=A0A4P9YDA5_ROZAC|nr:hypothetical protein ROZALSC1DRAFT_24544 [Rozella allomycis CSF55]
MSPNWKFKAIMEEEKKRVHENRNKIESHKQYSDVRDLFIAIARYHNVNISANDAEDLALAARYYNFDRIAIHPFEIICQDDTSRCGFLVSYPSGMGKTALGNYFVTHRKGLPENRKGLRCPSNFDDAEVIYKKTHGLARLVTQCAYRTPITHDASVVIQDTFYALADLFLKFFFYCSENISVGLGDEIRGNNGQRHDVGSLASMFMIPWEDTYDGVKLKFSHWLQEVIQLNTGKEGFKATRNFFKALLNLVKGSYYERIVDGNNNAFPINQLLIDEKVRGRRVAYAFIHSEKSSSADCGFLALRNTDTLYGLFAQAKKTSNESVDNDEILRMGYSKFESVQDTCEHLFDWSRKFYILYSNKWETKLNMPLVSSSIENVYLLDVMDENCVEFKLREKQKRIGVTIGKCKGIKKS